MPAPEPISSPHSTHTPPQFGLIVIGDEILSGRRADKHLPHTIELLGTYGLSLAWAQVVGDDPVRITAVLRQVLTGSDVVFCCGGIGATPDDHTRPCAAAAAGVSLLPHPQAQSLIAERIADMARSGTIASADLAHPDNIQRLRMSELPQGADIVPNPYNRIPGFALGQVYFLPGFPVMAWPMMEWILHTHYRDSLRHGATHPVHSAIVTGGALEAALTPLMQHLQDQYPGLKVSSLPSVSHPIHGPHVELGVHHPQDDATARTAFAEMLQRLADMGYSAHPTADTAAARQGQP